MVHLCFNFDERSDAFKFTFFNVASRLDHFLKLILQRPENQVEGCQLFDMWHVTVAIYDSYLEFTYSYKCVSCPSCFLTLPIVT